MRVAVLASGAGTNLQALLDAQDAGWLAPAEIALVLCNRPGATALDRARDAGIPGVVVDHTAFDDRAEFERAMLAETSAHGIEAVVLAGFMRVLTSVFVGAFGGRILNTHPSLLPAFPGIRAPAQALDYGAKLSGCTIHLVDDSIDGGPIVLQAAVPILDGDSPDTLRARIQREEHRLLPEAVRLLAAGRLLRDGRHVRVAPSTGDASDRHGV